jgi:hypothetical protein
MSGLGTALRVRNFFRASCVQSRVPYRDDTDPLRIKEATLAVELAQIQERERAVAEALAATRAMLDERRRPRAKTRRVWGFVVLALAGLAITISNGQAARQPSPLIRAGSPACGEQLLVNGDFEAPTIANGSWQVRKAIQGWQTSFGPGLELQRHVAGEPYRGEQFVELDSNASSGIYQDVTTHEDELYDLAFAFSARGGTTLKDNHVRVLWNGVEVASVIAESTNPDWRVQQIQLRGREGTSRLELEDVGVSNSFGTYVDTVSLTLRCSD